MARAISGFFGGSAASEVLTLGGYLAKVLRSAKSGFPTSFAAQLDCGRILLWNGFYGGSFLLWHGPKLQQAIAVVNWAATFYSASTQRGGAEVMATATNDFP